MGRNKHLLNPGCQGVTNWSQGLCALCFWKTAHKCTLVASVLVEFASLYTYGQLRITVQQID